MRQDDADQAYEVLMSSLDEWYDRSVVDYFLMQWPSGQFVAVDLTGRVVGYIAGARLENGSASVSLLAVSEGCRNMGIGTRLLQSLMAAARISGIGRVQLEVRDTNRTAVRFYQRRGFAVTEHLRGFYNDGGDGLRMAASPYTAGAT